MRPFQKGNLLILIYDNRRITGTVFVNNQLVATPTFSGDLALENVTPHTVLQNSATKRCYQVVRLFEIKHLSMYLVWHASSNTVTDFFVMLYLTLL